MIHKKILGKLLGGAANLLLPTVYDAKFGSNTAATAVDGWIVPTLVSGCRQIWCDASKADDSGGGFTPATAFKNWNTAWTLATGNGRMAGGGDGLAQAGDMFMVAGTGGREYFDTVAANISLCGGTGYNKPFWIVSYDPGDPTNTSKWGRLFGSNMPRVNIGTSLNMTSNFNVGYVVVMGLELVNGDIGIYGGTGANTPGIAFQNCRRLGCSLSFVPGTNSNTVGANSPGPLLSKCSSFGGQYASKGGQFIESQDSLVCEDCVFAHEAWSVGVSRSDTIAHGAPSALYHNTYFHASNTRMTLRRLVSTDSYEGFGIRGDAPVCSQLVAWGCAIGHRLGGFSGAGTEAPNGVTIKVDDMVSIAMQYHNSSNADSNPGGPGVQTTNCLLGSYANNHAILASRTKGNTAGYDCLVESTRPYPATQTVAQYMLCKNWSAWNHATISNIYTTNAISAGVEALQHIDWQNSICDVLPVAMNGTATGVSVRIGAPTGYLTEVQIATAMGFASVAALKNAMIFLPHLPWAAAISTICLPAMGLTPQFAAVAPPSVAAFGTIPQYYPTALRALTLASNAFVRGIPAQVHVLSVSHDMVLSSATLPAGVASKTISSITHSGTTATVTTATAHGLTTGCVISLTGVVAPTYSWPYNANWIAVTVTGANTFTYIMQADPGSDPTSYGAYTHQPWHLEGTYLYYDGSGTGASTPNVDFTETSNEALGTRTTTIALNISSGVTTATFDPANSADWTLDGTHLQATRTAASGFWALAWSTVSKNPATTAAAAAVTLTTLVGGAYESCIGLNTSGTISNGGPGFGSGDTNGISYRPLDGNIYFGSSVIATVAASVQSDKVGWTIVPGVSFDLYKNGTKLVSVLFTTLDTDAGGSSGITHNPVFFIVATGGSSTTGTVVTGDFASGAGW